MMKRNLKITEATTSDNAGHYKIPIVLAPQIWKKNQLGPFVEPVYHYTNAELAYQEADGGYLESPEKRDEIENKTEKISAVDMYLKQFYTGQNDEEGSALNPTMSGLPPKEVNFLKEDLAVWFGTKKKPKGSKQPKGPWVNICRKEDGKHPPCGRSKAETKGYPKCRAVHVASKMSTAQKRAACQQKRKAEKKDPKLGKGNKPTMTSYKPRNENIRKIIKSLLKEEYDSQRLYPVDYIYSMINKAPWEIKKLVRDLESVPCINNQGVKKMCARIPEVLYVYFSGRY